MDRDGPPKMPLCPVPEGCAGHSLEIEATNRPSHTGSRAMRYVVSYDIADDNRREDVATLLSGCGPRVQLSVFECETRSRLEIAGLRRKLRALIDPVEDQVRLYPLDDRAIRATIVLGALTIEERQ